MSLDEETFEWVGLGRIADFRDRAGHEMMPLPASGNHG
jgi:hypothetical protein